LRLLNKEWGYADNCAFPKNTKLLGKMIKIFYPNQGFQPTASAPPKKGYLPKVKPHSSFRGRGDPGDRYFFSIV
jgi:hypothetical protein